MLTNKYFPDLAMKHGGRKPSSSLHQSGGEISKDAGLTGRSGLGFLLLVFSRPHGCDGNNHPTSLYSWEAGTVTDVCTAVV